MISLDSFKTKRQLDVNGSQYDYFSLPELEKAGMKGITSLPRSLKILLENLLRHEDDVSVNRDDIQAIGAWLKTKTSDREISYRPARVLMQDFTGVPAVVDLGAMRDAIKKLGGDPEMINPLSPVDLVIDHSIQVDAFATSEAMQINSDMEMQRNNERYFFLRWGQKAFDNFRVVPPDTGICHQVNLEYLARTVWHSDKNGVKTAYPDTLVGTDSHTTMINGLGVLGWGVGGIEAEAAMLGQPISMLIPEVIGMKLSGKLLEGITATDLVLTITQMLRKKGVVGKFVEFFGPGLAELTVADRATIANMSPEYGATCGFFPVDHATLDYLRLTGRDDNTIALVETYTKKQGLWNDKDTPEPVFTDVLELNLSHVVPSLAGPKRPQDRVELADLPHAFNKLLCDANRENEKTQSYKTSADFEMHHGDVVIAAITSCTNTSNPSVLMAAGLVAKKALEKGLQTKPWVKTSLAPGSQVVTQYLKASGLQIYLDDLGFDLVGYGCTTCIGNSGPLLDPIANAVNDNDLIVSAVLSGNRNFEGRIHPQVKANWLASPPLVVVYALTGTTVIDVTKEPIGTGKDGKPVYLNEIWPSNLEIAHETAKVTSKMFREQYADVFTGNSEWQNMKVPESETYTWQEDSTYIQNPPFFTDMQTTPNKIKNIENARVLALFGDSITTDSSLKANSLFGSTGGQSVDTNNSVFNSNFTPSSHQLDTNEVDPVAEADVYIAYGRDAQAEEILKEALRTQPTRNAVRLKLLEIYSNRKDLRAFEILATELYGTTKGEGEDWIQAASLGIAIDPKNPLYAAGKLPEDTVQKPSALTAPTLPLDEPDLDALLAVTQSDASLETINTIEDSSYFGNTAVATEAGPAETPAKKTAAAASSNELDFDLQGINLEQIEVPNTITRTERVEPKADLDAINFDFLDEATAAPEPVEVEAASVGEATVAGMHDAGDTSRESAQPSAPTASESPAPMEFDLSDITLELNADEAKPGPALQDQPDVDGQDYSNNAEMATKLASVAMELDDGAYPLLAKVEAALAASTVYNKEVTIDFEQLKKDVADISIAVEEDTLTVPQMERVWQALGQMEDGLRCTLRQDGLDIQWLEDEQELRINPAARTLREILEKSETRE